MLRHLHVRNLAVLSEASVEFGPGLNVVTGETGAGKSLVVDSLSLLAGARASAELIRTGADVCSVTGIFQPRSEDWRKPMIEAGIDVDGDEIVVRREVARNGRNRVFLNDQPVTLRLLGEVGPSLLRIHGQRDELGLLSPELQRHWLDRHGAALDPAGAQERLGLCRSLYVAWLELEQRLEKLRADDRTRHERIDLLRFQISEIEAAGIEEGEEDRLRRERDLLRHSGEIGEALGGAVQQLDEESAASELLARARSELRKLGDWHPEAGEWRRELDELIIRVDEMARSMRGALDDVETDPTRLDGVEGRLALLERLLRKYGPTSAEALAHLETSRAELADLDGNEEQRERLETEAAQALEAYREAAAELTRARSRWARSLEESIGEELRDLALAKASFQVALETRARTESPLRIGGQGVDFGPSGVDQVTFLLAANPGEEARPLSKVASGGELARVYLALQVAVRGSRGEASQATLVFDEVDSGIGGQEAAAVGRKLKSLGRGGQILAVTHLPQVASFGDLHFGVHKRVERDRTHTDVEALRDDRRVDEVARMLAGEEVTSVSRSHAEELLAGASGG